VHLAAGLGAHQHEVIGEGANLAGVQQNDIGGLLIGAYFDYLTG